MVREPGELHRKTDSFPLARGDGPVYRVNYTTTYRFSPRPWGWSVRANTACLGLAVIPTLVGMVRVDGSNRVRMFRFPRGRGDGPTERKRE